MSLFEGTAPPNVTTTETVKSSTPQYLTDYLTNLAQAGQTQLGQPSGGLIAGLPQNLQDLYSGAQDKLNNYQPAMDASLQALQSGATGVTGEDISKFYDPYQQDVINSLEQQSALSTQRNLMPALKAAFAGQGGFGSQRYAGAMGQTLADVQTGLAGKEAALKSEGYKSALDAALKERGYDIQAGQGLYNLGSAESTADINALKTLGDVGTQELSYNQSKIEAPLTRAQNVAKLLQGYTYPTTTEKTYVGPASSYGPSALSQIAGLGSLLGSGFNTSSGWGNQLVKALGNLNWSGSTGDLRSGSNLITGGENLTNDTAGSAATDSSNPFPVI